MVAFPFAQLVGHGAFMQVIMGDDYSRDYRRMIEEIGGANGLWAVANWQLRTDFGDENDCYWG